jgi:tetratricopeptide (TPR) repeat protein
MPEPAPKRDQPDETLSLGTEFESRPRANPYGGAMWGPFELREKVGQGGFGEVYRAWDPQLKREVALKLLRKDGATDADYQAILKEARLAARVRHPNVVAVFGVDRHEGRVGFWSDFVHGKDIGQILATQGPMGSTEAALIGIEVCRALGAVHAAGLLHRDIKSTNVMREEGGRILLLDFGLSQESTTRRENPGSGTLLYMAPELIAGKEASAASDIYALGVMLYHLTTGRFPVDPMQARDPRAPRRRLIDLRPDLPAAFVTTVEAAMAPDPARRYASAGAMMAALMETLTQSEARAAAIGVPPPPRRAWIPMAGAAILLAGAAVYWQFERRTAPPFANEDYARGQQLLERYDIAGNVDGAVQLYERLTQREPRFALAWAGLSDAYAARFDATKAPGLLEQARVAAAKAVELDTQHPRPHLALGRVYVRATKNDLAASELEQALALDSRNAPAYGELGLLYEQQGRAAEAEKALRMACDLAPTDWRWMNRLGLYLRRAGRTKEAIEQFRQVTERHPDSVFGYSNLALCYRAIGDFDNAGKFYRRALELDPQYLLALTGLGGLLSWQGKYDEATALLERVTRAQPENYLGWANLATALYWQGSRREEAIGAYGKALKLLEKLIEEQPANADYLSAASTYSAVTGDRDAALRRIRQARAISPADATVLARAAMTHELLGDREQAIAAMLEAMARGYSKEFLERNPEFAGLRKDPKFVARMKRPSVK